MKPMIKIWWKFHHGTIITRERMAQQEKTSNYKSQKKIPVHAGEGAGGGGLPRGAPEKSLFANWKRWRGLWLGRAALEFYWDWERTSIGVLNRRLRPSKLRNSTSRLREVIGRENRRWTAMRRDHMERWCMEIVFFSKLRRRWSVGG